MEGERFKKNSKEDLEGASIVGFEAISTAHPGAQRSSLLNMKISL